MKKLIAANWKMYKVPHEARIEAEGLKTLLSSADLAEKEVVLFVPAINLISFAALCHGGAFSLPFTYGGQNFYPAEEGAFTGENSLNMISATGANWVLIGHSERRMYFHEDNAFLAQKLEFALNKGFSTVFCIGESLEEREANKLEEVLTNQLKEGLAKLPKDYEVEKLSIAYEPVWAIGTGKVANEADIEHAHSLVRKILAEIIQQKAEETRILYGGSVKPDNAASILKIKNVDGVLVGGASLDAESFNKIVIS